MEIRDVHPVLRAYDVPASLAFYVDYLGFTQDWQDGETPGPIYLQLSRGPLRLHLSTHHGDGTPGSLLVVEVTGIRDWVAELRAKQYPFYNPGVGHGPGENMISTQLLDPAGNMLRFFGAQRLVTVMNNGTATPVPIILSPRSRRIAAVAAVVLNVAWLSAHLTGGALFATARHIAGGTFGASPNHYLWRPDLDPTALHLASITNSLMLFLIPAIPLVLLSWAWLPARGRFALAWALLWPVGMIGYIGYGTYLFE